MSSYLRFIADWNLRALNVARSLHTASSFILKSYLMLRPAKFPVREMFAIIDVANMEAQSVK